MVIPQNVQDVLSKLNDSDKAVVEAYIASLLEVQQEQEGNNDASADNTAHQQQETDSLDEQPASSFPPVYDPSSNNEDYDQASTYKQEAADFNSTGKLPEALDKYTQAILAAPPSALLYANRAIVLLKLQQPRAAIRDCDLALAQNPDSAKALRTRGQAYMALQDYELALRDLSASQQIDFDESVVQDLKFLTEQRVQMEKEEAQERNKKQDQLRKKAEEIRQAKEQAQREQKASTPMAGMPNMPGGMPPGMPDMSALMSDPEIVAAMQNPKVLQALQGLMSGPGGMMSLLSNPGKIQELMADPEVGPVFQKILAKFTGGGMPGATGNPGGAGGAHEDDMDDIPEL